MNYKAYTLDTLGSLGIHKFLKGAEYIAFGIEYLFLLTPFTTPESEMIYDDASKKFSLTPVAIENSMRNTIQLIWSQKKNPELMVKIFGSYNMKKRPCNMEFLVLLYNYIRLYFEGSDNVNRLNDIWEENKKTHREHNNSSTK